MMWALLKGSRKVGFLGSDGALSAGDEAEESLFVGRRKRRQLSLALALM